MKEEKVVSKEYDNGEITVVWKPGLCMHATLCFSGLPEVFNPRARPWIKIDGATTDRLIEQVNKCPSGALSYYRKDQGAQAQPPAPAGHPVVEVTNNGPLIIRGVVTVLHPDGREEQREKSTALCRCGASGNKPFCDGSHRRIGFEG